MFTKVAESDFVRGEHKVLRLWAERQVFDRLRAQNARGERWSFLDGPVTANNPIGVHHAWGRSYKDVFQRYHAMNGKCLRYQQGFDCQGLWVEVEVEKELGLGSKRAIEEYGIDKFVNLCKRRVLRFAARQTEQSIRLGYWMEWDHPDELRKLAEGMGTDELVSYRTPRGLTIDDQAHRIAARLGNAEWGGSYFTFSTENNETIWGFLKSCHERGKVYRGHDVMPWSGRAGSAYSQMEVVDGRKLTTHRALFVRFPLTDAPGEALLVWTTTPWTLTSNVAAAVSADLEYARVRVKRDGSILYMAQAALTAPRLEKEFKEGFGRPEWGWPKSAPKLKTIAQMLNEQGGYEILGTVPGSALVGRPYAGPFDELPAQQSPGGFPPEPGGAAAASASHRVIDGGRDTKGNPNVTADEGTGIVHIAPGCGDVDFKLGEALGLPRVAPLAEDGTFLEGFGPLSGRVAVAPETVEAIVGDLRQKGVLLAAETYPHIYPFCWRTGDELVFRVVDEWLINMDWRQEIIDITGRIRWLPAEIQGEAREVEWLTSMRDWMISKKRYWGLALPIWVEERDGRVVDFEVIGSLAELREKAIAGAEVLDEQTPHRPWIDRVQIRNPRTGNVMGRVPDVGNPWLDAGIVPFSTMGYRADHAEWEKWYPADFVVECFPGQFRNWFYSMLAMATMVDGSPPFKNLLGHRLVMDERGRPMHKSDGTAIWFEEAAEQLGVDVLRWMYLEHDPAGDIRFGMRHRDQPVTLETVDGPISRTREGEPTCLVTSKPAEEARRQVLIPLWNSYAFLINYAIADEWDPRGADCPPAERPEIDRWLLSRLQGTIEVMRAGFEAFDTRRSCRGAFEFIEDLSTWYIRRNRRRFWRSREGGDRDKLAAYRTLHEALVALTKLLAPILPFLTERMYQNLVVSHAPEAPESVHLCAYPTVDASLRDPALELKMATVQRVVRLGHRLREEEKLRVRLPLAEVRVVCPNPEQARAVADLGEVIRDELNVKAVTQPENLDDLVSYTYSANPRTLGPRVGKLLGALKSALANADPATLAPLRNGQDVTIDVSGQAVTLHAEDVQVGVERRGTWATADEAGIQVAVSTAVTAELVREGMARDLVRQIQQMRKDRNFEIQDRIPAVRVGGSAEVAAMLAEWGDYIRGETLADRIEAGDGAPDARRVEVGEEEISLGFDPA